MKKKLIATTLTLLLAIGAGAAPQAQSPTPQDSQEIEATAQPNAIEVFSDTTSTTTAAAAVPANSDDADESDDDAEELFEKMVRHTFTFTDTTFAGMFFLLALLFILFVLSPIGILALLFYFIYKNRKQRLKFAEQAMKNGQTIPDGFVNAQPTAPSNDLRTKGIRQLFLGIGLMVLLYNVAGNIGLGIGALVACIGLGNLVVSRSDNNRKNQDNNINQEQNIQYYD